MFDIIVENRYQDIISGVLYTIIEVDLFKFKLSARVCLVYISLVLGQKKSRDAIRGSIRARMTPVLKHKKIYNL